MPLSSKSIVSKLPWAYDEFQSIWVASSVLGQYQAWEINGKGVYRLPSMNEGRLAGGNIDLAKSLAQVHFAQTILSAVDVSETEETLAKLTEALEKAADQLTRAHDDAFRQCAGYGLVTSDGRDFTCLELNKCSEAASAARETLSAISGLSRAETAFQEDIRR